MGTLLKVIFEALMKELRLKSLVSLDKVARLTLDFSAEDAEVVDKLNRLMKADDTVEITIRAQGEKGEG